jgi:hypothetical protein
MGSRDRSRNSLPHPEQEALPPAIRDCRQAHAAGETVGWLLNERGYTSKDERAKLRDLAAVIIEATT